MATLILCVYCTNVKCEANIKGIQIPGALRYLGGRMRSLSKIQNTPKALISDQKGTLILIKMLTFSSK